MFLWIASAFAAYFVKGVCGFANTLVLTSILSFRAVNADISPIDLLLGYPSNLILAWRNRRSLDPKVWIPLSLLVLAGSIPGALLLKNAGTGTIRIVFGFVVIFLGAEMLLREYGYGLPASKSLLGLIGVLSGVLCGLFGVGALLAAYVSRATTDMTGFKANISAVFIVENTFRLFLYGALGLFTAEIFRTFLLLIPFALLGLFLGIKSSGVLSEKLVRRLTAVLLIVSGISLVIQNLP